MRHPLPSLSAVGPGPRSQYSGLCYPESPGCRKKPALPPVGIVHLPHRTWQRPPQRRRWPLRRILEKSLSPTTDESPQFLLQHLFGTVKWKIVKETCIGLPVIHGLLPQMPIFRLGLGLICLERHRRSLIQNTVGGPLSQQHATQSRSNHAQGTNPSFSHRIAPF